MVWYATSRRSNHSTVQDLARADSAIISVGPQPRIFIDADINMRTYANGEPCHCRMLFRGLSEMQRSSRAANQRYSDLTFKLFRVSQRKKVLGSAGRWTVYI